MNKDSKLIWEGYEDQQERWNTVHQLKAAIENGLSPDQIADYYLKAVNAKISLDILEDIIDDAVIDKILDKEIGQHLKNLGIVPENLGTGVGRAGGPILTVGKSGKHYMPGDLKKEGSKKIRRKKKKGGSYGMGDSHAGNGDD